MHKIEENLFLNAFSLRGFAVIMAILHLHLELVCFTPFFFFNRTPLTRWCGSQGSGGNQTACELFHSRGQDRRSPRWDAECVWRAWWSSSAASGNSCPCWAPPEWSYSVCGRRSFPPGHPFWPPPAPSRPPPNQNQPRSRGCPGGCPESLRTAWWKRLHSGTDFVILRVGSFSGPWTHEEHHQMTAGANHQRNGPTYPRELYSLEMWFPFYLTQLHWNTYTFPRINSRLWTLNHHLLVHVNACSSDDLYYTSCVSRISFRVFTNSRKHSFPLGQWIILTFFIFLPTKIADLN